MKSFFLFTAATLFALSASAQSNPGSTPSAVRHEAQVVNENAQKNLDHEVGTDKEVQKEKFWPLRTGESHVSNCFYGAVQGVDGPII